MLMRGLPHGAPCWFELTSADADAGRAFWSGLLGWDCDDAPLPGGAVYTTFLLHGGKVGACTGQMPGTPDGTPSGWTVYFAVPDTDAAAAAATAAGGRVVFGPMDVSDLGRMALVADPEGAVFGLWQARQHHGVERIHEERAVGWVELAARDTEAAAGFYRQVLGWSAVTEKEMGPAGLYRVFSAGGTQWGGLLRMTAEWGDMPAHWSIYWRTPDVDASIEQAKALGGEMCFPAFDAPGVGRIGRINDPQGAGAYLVAMPPGS